MPIVLSSFDYLLLKMAVHSLSLLDAIIVQNQPPENYVLSCLSYMLLFMSLLNDFCNILRYSDMNRGSLQGRALNSQTIVFPVVSLDPLIHILNSN